MFVRVIKSYRDIVAVCDKDLIGKKFEEGNLQLDVKENFYKGNLVSEEELAEIMKDMLKEDATFNIVGKKSIEVALKTGAITEEGIKKIQGIPFALVLM